MPKLFSEIISSLQVNFVPTENIKIKT